LEPNNNPPPLQSTVPRGRRGGVRMPCQVRFGSDSDFMTMSAVRQLSPQNWGSQLAVALGPRADFVEAHQLGDLHPSVVTLALVSHELFLTLWTQACDLGNIRIGNCAGANAARHNCFCESLFSLLPRAGPAAFPAALCPLIFFSSEKPPGQRLAVRL
jgi:hypothetical protein